MTSRDENLTAAPEPKIAEVQTVPPSPDGFHARPGPRRRTSILVAALALAVLALLIYSGIHSRAVPESRLTQRTQEAPIPTSPLIFPKKAPPTPHIVLPA